MKWAKKCRNSVFGNSGINDVKKLSIGIAHPHCDALPHALPESTAEGAVAAETAFQGKLLGTDGLLGSNNFLIAADEVVDAQIVDIAVVSDALTREILAEIEAVRTDGLSQLLQREVVLQVELRTHAVLSQQLFDLGKVDRSWRSQRLICQIRKLRQCLHAPQQ